MDVQTLRPKGSMKPTHALHSSNWKHVTSSDSLRPDLQGVFFDKDKQSLVATNGHLLLVMPVELSQSDVSALINVEVFDKAATHYTVTEAETTAHYSGGKKISHPNLAEQFPVYEQLLEGHKDPQAVQVMGMDVQQVAKLYSCLKPVSTDAQVPLKLFFNGHRKAVTFEWVKDSKVRGVVMPYLIEQHAP